MPISTASPRRQFIERPAASRQLAYCAAGYVAIEGLLGIDISALYEHCRLRLFLMLPLSI